LALVLCWGRLELPGSWYFCTLGLEVAQLVYEYAGRLILGVAATTFCLLQFLEDLDEELRRCMLPAHASGRQVDSLVELVAL